MVYFTPSILLAAAVLCCCLLFLLRSAQALQAAPVGLSWINGEPTHLSFAGTCHPMERQDRLPVILLTLVYACTAFFQLGDTTAPQTFLDFGSGETVSVALEETVRPHSLRYYTGLGTGSYRVEVSADGEHWSTLWEREEEGTVSGYYWADAAGYSPHYAMTQKYNQLFKWVDVELDNSIDFRYLRIEGKADQKKLANGEKQSVLQLGRFCLLDEAGQVIALPFSTAQGNTADEEALSALFSTEDVPESSSWHNSTYFDEIYHARTAKEHIDGLYPYEVTHPPLGKLIQGIGIRIFGMTPFGWRFMGTLCGVAMLPLLYVFLKNLFGKTVVATCGTALFAAGFMHLTQTRIATIDSYAVFFILGMYWMMYRYLSLSAGTSFRKGALPLFLSGLFWAFGISSKWTVIYGGLGLAVVYFIGLWQKLRDWPAPAALIRQELPTAEDAAPLPGGRLSPKTESKWPWLGKTLAFSVLCFILIPFVIYTASYLPYAKALDVDLSLGNTLRGVGESLPILLRDLWGRLTQGTDFEMIPIPQDSLPGIMANNQWYMLTYHQGVSQVHPYASRWFQWVVDARPILYYMDNSVAGYTTRFASFGNPVVVWAGLGAILICGSHCVAHPRSKAILLGSIGLIAAGRTIRSECSEIGVFSAELSTEELVRNGLILLACLLLYLGACALLIYLCPGHSGKAAFLFVGYLSQLAPWWLISRTTFAYHYFPSLLFLVLAISYLFDRLCELDPGWKRPVYGLTGLAVGCYALFYPVLIGLQIPSWYQPFVKWLESWPF